MYQGSAISLMLILISHRELAESGTDKRNAWCALSIGIDDQVENAATAMRTCRLLGASTIEHGRGDRNHNNASICARQFVETNDICKIEPELFCVMRLLEEDGRYLVMTDSNANRGCRLATWW